MLWWIMLIDVGMIHFLVLFALGRSVVRGKFNGVKAGFYPLLALYGILCLSAIAYGVLIQ